MRITSEKIEFAHKAVPTELLLKGMAGFSVAVLSLFGVTVPLLGYDPGVAAMGAAAGVGAIIGALVALRA